MQGRGRAGRNGAPGSSELIVNYMKYMNDKNIPIEKEEVFIERAYEENIAFFSEYVRDHIEK